MYFDKPPPLWIPERPAIIRAALPLSPQERRMLALFQPGFIGRVKTATVAVGAAGATASSSNPHTFTLSFGAAQSDRLIVAAVNCFFSASSASAVSIGGVAASKVTGTAVGSGTASARADLWIAAVPTGASGNVVITGVGAGAQLECSTLILYGASIASPSVAVNQGASTNSLAAAVTLVLNGAAIAAMASSTASGGSSNWTNLTKRDDGVNSNLHYSTAMDGSLPAGSRSVTCANTNTGAMALAVAAWAPA